MQNFSLVSLTLSMKAPIHAPPSAMLPPTAIKKANTVVKNCANFSGKLTGAYVKLTPEIQAGIVKHASLHGNQVTSPMVLVSTWKKKYKI